MNTLNNNQILEVFHKRAPNFLTLDNLAYDLADKNRDDISKRVEQLCNDRVLKKTEGNNGVKDHYELPSYENLPFKEYMNISGIKIPRILANDRPRPEDINIFFECLAKHSSSMEAEFDRIVEKRLQSYWANIIVLFGIFISLFAFIVTSIGRINIDSNSGVIDVLTLNIVQVLPISIVLLVFVWVLKKLFH